MLQTTNCADREDSADRDLLAPEFQLFHYARHWQIHSWPITQSTSIGIQFYNIMRLFSALEEMTFSRLWNFILRLSGREMKVKKKLIYFYE